MGDQFGRIEPRDSLDRQEPGGDLLHEGFELDFQLGNVGVELTNRLGQLAHDLLSNL